MKKKFVTISNLNNLSGFGHFNRTKILLKNLSKKNDRFFFSNNKIDFISEVKTFYNNFQTFENIDEMINRCLFLSNSHELIIILDLYNLSSTYVKKLHQNKIKIIQFNNRIDQKIYCDYFINFSPLIAKKNINPRLIYNKSCKFFLGPKYFLLRNSLIKNRKRRVNRKIKNIFICFGSSIFLKKQSRLLKIILDQVDEKQKVYIFSKQKFHYFIELKKNIKILKL